MIWMLLDVFMGAQGGPEILGAFLALEHANMLMLNEVWHFCAQLDQLDARQ